MQGAGQQDGQGGEPDDEGGIGVKDLRPINLRTFSVGSADPALRHQEEPDLIVAWRGKKSQECSHSGCGQRQKEKDSVQYCLCGFWLGVLCRFWLNA